MKNIRYFFIIVLMHLTITANSQHSLNATNLAHQYNPDSEIDLKLHPVHNNDTITVHVKLTLNQGKTQLYDYVLNFFTASSYAEKLTAITGTDSTYTGSKESDYFFIYNIPASEISEILIVQVQSRFSGQTYYFEILADKNSLLLKGNNGFVKFNSWISPGEYSFNRKDQVYGYFYKHKFPPALPPMPVKESSLDQSLAIDSTFQVADSSFSLTKQGLYLFQLDTSSSVGLSFRLENKYFPRLAKLENLTEPLIYITTREENEVLRDINGEKKKFDKFWLDLTNSPERAKNIIKGYFERVEQANKLFTTYKEGWKTDKGMIYIIFGPPDEVTKTLNGEIWSYLASPSLPKVRFDFVRTQSIFGPDYALIRDKSHANMWYRAVDFWRKGRF